MICGRLWIWCSKTNYRISEHFFCFSSVVKSVTGLALKRSDVYTRITLQCQFHFVRFSLQTYWINPTGYDRTIDRSEYKECYSPPARKCAHTYNVQRLLCGVTKSFHWNSQRVGVQVSAKFKDVYVKLVATNFEQSKDATWKRYTNRTWRRAMKPEQFEASSSFWFPEHHSVTYTASVKAQYKSIRFVQGISWIVKR